MILNPTKSLEYCLRSDRVEQRCLRDTSTSTQAFHQMPFACHTLSSGSHHRICPSPYQQPPHWHLGWCFGSPFPLDFLWPNAVMPAGRHRLNGFLAPYSSFKGCPTREAIWGSGNERRSGLQSILTQLEASQPHIISRLSEEKQFRRIYVIVEG
jgi:hypothetical protein